MRLYNQCPHFHNWHTKGLFGCFPSLSISIYGKTEMKLNTNFGWIISAIRLSNLVLLSVVVYYFGLSAVLRTAYHFIGAICNWKLWWLELLIRSLLPLQFHIRFRYEISRSEAFLSVALCLLLSCSIIGIFSSALFCAWMRKRISITK